MTARWESLNKAVARFAEALDAPETAMNRDATIQRFEFCFELAWKVIQETARGQGLSCQSPKSCLRLAFQQGWLDDEERWLAMLEDRNRTSHTYDEAFAHQLYGRLGAYLEPLQHLTARLREPES
ncbi:hypothetical protein AN478_00390 [Thiohalorhabdus denitrificans]|uniref:Nucleotidyltransferase substrate binding protein, HI0074 family n=1 Tax=Thiohalorhabdus denitrificans TaxID=381306 RepID=A0A0P9ET32_9GAMM|nr:HI0074 family nucleotidyltransferase substrate-binding subunit [Thiohalorhabdus denitrificans]KPV41891.1 hypothetical protein AN478_00390 [Thiohalorhabdus denitrificans]SCY65601.1 nucleotidyltransferase substrate binding protein, HI0074 family [Thiohalorhabdus denitrificans]